MEQPRSATLDLAHIRPPQVAARLSIDGEQLGQLADDIAANGLLQPIGVAGPDDGGEYEIGFGHRRYLAHKLLNRSTIDARVWPAGTPLEDIRSSENYQRAQLSPIEEALDVARRLARGEPRSGIARVLRRSLAWVNGRAALLDLPDELQQLVHEGALSIGVAVELAAIDHEPYRRQLALEAQEHGASVTTARVWRAHYDRDKARIIGNALTVEEVRAARQEFVPYFRCPSCDREVPYTETSAFRFCAPCGAEIDAAITGRR